MDGSKKKRRSILAFLIALLLLVTLTAVLFVVTLVVLPDASLSLQLLLSILGAAILGAAGFFSGLTDTYNFVLDLMERFLDSSAPPDEEPLIGQFYNIPPLPSFILPRPTELEDLKTKVIDVTKKQVPPTGFARAVGLYGEGGVGKTILAATLAYDDELRSIFTDGIFWLTLTQQPNLVFLQEELARAFGENDTFKDEEEGKIKLRALLAKKACLIILDDVWNANHVFDFGIPDRGLCRLLFTTRDETIIQALEAVEHKLSTLNDEMALTLLAQAAGVTKASLPELANQIIIECANLPIALAMTGKMAASMFARQRAGWEYALHRLQQADLRRIKGRFRDYPYPNLFNVIDASVSALNTDESLGDLDPAKRYLELAIFSEDALIPERVLQMLWEPVGINREDTEDIAALFVSRSLAQQEKKMHLRLHDLQVDYVRSQVGNVDAMHQRLIDSCLKELPEGFLEYLNDNYFGIYFPYHALLSGNPNQAFLPFRDFREYLLFHQRGSWGTEDEIILMAPFLYTYMASLLVVIHRVGDGLPFTARNIEYNLRSVLVQLSLAVELHDDEYDEMRFLNYRRALVELEHELSYLLKALPPES